MPAGSRLHVSWLDFCVYLSAFEGSVYRGVSKKMDYHMWRKLKCNRENKTQVIIEKCDDSFIVIIGHEDEYHRFYRGDESFGDFLFENLIDVKEYGHDWDKYNMPLSNTLNVPVTEAIELTKDIAVNCGRALKASAKATKDKLLDFLDDTRISVMADPGPSISCVIDTKVDRAELDSKLEALSDKIQAVADKYNNINEKENSTMNAFKFDFGPVNGNAVRMSMYGMAVKNKAGTWVSYDTKAGEIMDVDVFNFDGANFMYKMPVAMKDIAVGDVVIHHGAPMFVTGKSTDEKGLVVIDVIAGERKEVMLAKSPFGFNFATKVVNFLGNAFNGSATAENPFGNMWMLMAMSGDNKDMKDMLPFMMMANGGMDMSNPMLMYALMGDGKMDPMMLALMSGAFNPAPAHECKCGGNCDNHNN